MLEFWRNAEYPFIAIAPRDLSIGQIELFDIQNVSSYSSRAITFTFGQIPLGKV